MNCKNCNQDLTSFMFLKGFNYCPYCGFEINGEKKEEVKRQPKKVIKQENEARNNYNLLYAIICILLFIGCLLLLFINNSGKVSIDNINLH